MVSQRWRTLVAVFPSGVLNMVSCGVVAVALAGVVAVELAGVVV